MILLLVLVVLAAVAVLDAARRQPAAEARFTANQALAAWAALTDLCLFSDARYSRHPALADRHSPLQDAPFALEHFPSGSFVPPPGHLRPGDRVGLGRQR